MTESVCLEMLKKHTKGNAVHGVNAVRRAYE
jgi:hypothetical protein